MVGTVQKRDRPGVQAAVHPQKILLPRTCAGRESGWIGHAQQGWRDVAGKIARLGNRSASDWFASEANHLQDAVRQCCAGRLHFHIARLARCRAVERVTGIALEVREARGETECEADPGRVSPGRQWPVQQRHGGRASLGDRLVGTVETFGRRQCRGIGHVGESGVEGHQPEAVHRKSDQPEKGRKRNREEDQHEPGLVGHNAEKGHEGSPGPGERRTLGADPHRVTRLSLGNSADARIATDDPNRLPKNRGV